ncbi:MAG TPA: hypothetical protein VI455_05735 [Terriglobia bacterium]
MKPTWTHRLSPKGVRRKRRCGLHGGGEGYAARRETRRCWQRISDWKPHPKHSLKGFFTATLPSGLVLHDLMLHQNNGSRWIGFPAREWKAAQGNRQFARFIEFSERAASDRFRDQVLIALDKHLEAQS